MAKDMGPFRDSQAPSWFSGAQTDVPAEMFEMYHFVKIANLKKKTTFY